jgi:hypothetical protein
VQGLEEDGSREVRSEFRRDARPGLLAGEQPETDQAEDIEHWITVYTELIEGTRRLQGVVSTGEQREGRMDEEIERLRDRLAYWLDRRARLSPPAEDAGPAQLPGAGSAHS